MRKGGGGLFADEGAIRRDYEVLADWLEAPPSIRSERRSVKRAAIERRELLSEFAAGVYDAGLLETGGPASPLSTTRMMDRSGSRIGTTRRRFLRKRQFASRAMVLQPLAGGPQCPLNVLKVAKRPRAVARFRRRGGSGIALSMRLRATSRALPLAARISLVMKGSPVRVRASAFSRSRNPLLASTPSSSSSPGWRPRRRRFAHAGSGSRSRSGPASRSRWGTPCRLRMARS